MAHPYIRYKWQPSPCTKDAAIAAIEANYMRMFQTLERLEKGQDRFIEMLEKISAQSEHMKAIDARVGVAERSISAIDERVRGIEMQPAEQNTAVRNGVLIAVFSAVFAYFFAKFGK